MNETVKILAHKLLQILVYFDTYHTVFRKEVDITRLGVVPLLYSDRELTLGRQWTWNIFKLKNRCQQFGTKDYLN